MPPDGYTTITVPISLVTDLEQLATDDPNLNEEDSRRSVISYLKDRRYEEIYHKGTVEARLKAIERRLGEIPTETADTLETRLR